jgi:hypothetical protein
LLYSHFYGGNIEIQFSGLCTPGFAILLNAENLQSSPLKRLSLKIQQKEREAELALRRPLAEEHRAWGEKGLFAVRSSMTAKVPYNLMIADICEFNVDLDADAYPLIAFCPLTMCGRDEHHFFFQFIRAPPRWKLRLGF